jgi:N-acetylmuramoyl-L-alanine amidase
MGFAPSLYHAEPIPGESKPFADRTNGIHYYDNLVVLHSASQPAVLVEAGVIVNRAEELVLREPGTHRLIAAAMAEGARACLGAPSALR